MSVKGRNILATLLVLVMTLSLFAGCTSETLPEVSDPTVESETPVPSETPVTQPQPKIVLTEPLEIVSNAANDLIGDGIDHEWVECVPSGYAAKNDTDKVTLLIDLHGTGGTGKGAAKMSTLMRQIGERENMIIVYPSCTEAPSWNDSYRLSDADNSDVQYLNGLIDYLIGKYDIDTERIFMGGGSNGEIMSVRFGCSEYANRLAGLILQIGPTDISKMWDSDYTQPGAAAIRPKIKIPVYQYRGAADLIINKTDPDGAKNVDSTNNDEAAKCKINEFAKNIWLVSNGIIENENVNDAIPEISIIGDRNFEIYRGDVDLFYIELVGAGHAGQDFNAEYAWENIISRYSRDSESGNIVATSDGVLKGDVGAVALVGGSNNAFINNAIVSLDAAVFIESATEFYAPLDLLEKAYGATVTYNNGGKQAVIKFPAAMGNMEVSVEDGTATVSVDGKTVQLTDSVIYRNNTLSMPIVSFAESVLGLYATSKEGAVYISDHVATMTYGTYYTLARILGAG